VPGEGSGSGGGEKPVRSSRRGGARRRRLAAVRSADRFSSTLLLRPNFRGFV
jgi:hypothetical protein